MRLLFILCSIISTCFIAGCGPYVPDHEEFYETKIEGRTFVAAIVEHVECEVRTAVQSAVLDDIDLANVRARAGLPGKRQIDWLDTWGAQVILTLTTDEKSTLAPGVSQTNPLPTGTSFFRGLPNVTTPQSFALGLGGNLSSQATRKDTLSIFMDFHKFTTKVALATARQAKDAGLLAHKCDRSGGVLILSDLKLADWLYSTTLPASLQSGPLSDYSASIAEEAKASKKDVIAHEVTFVVVYGGSVTPAWKFVRVSANPSGTFFSAQRTKTQDLNITLGPIADGVLAPAAQNVSLSNQFGLAVGNVIKTN